MPPKGDEYYLVILDIKEECIEVGFSGEREPQFTRKIPYNIRGWAGKVPSYLGLNDALLPEAEKEEAYEYLFKANNSLREVFKIYSQDIRSCTLSHEEYVRMLQQFILDSFVNDLLISPQKCKLIILHDGMSLIDMYRLSDYLLNTLAVNSLMWRKNTLFSVLSSFSSDSLVIKLNYNSMHATSVIDLRIVKFEDNLGEISGQMLYYECVRRLIELEDQKVTAFLSSFHSMKILKQFCKRAMFIRDKNEVIELDEFFELSNNVFIPNSLRYEIPEYVFFERGSIHNSIKEFLSNNPIDTRLQLKNNIILMGEYIHIPGLVPRLLSELKPILGSQVNVIETIGAWTGCSLYISSLIKQGNFMWRNSEINSKNLSLAILEE